MKMTGRRKQENGIDVHVIQSGATLGELLLSTTLSSALLAILSANRQQWKKKKNLDPDKTEHDPTIVSLYYIYSFILFIWCIYMKIL